jgi:hypothetical protein
MKTAWLGRAFVALVVLASLISSIQNLISTRSLGSTTDDPVADWERRFGPLKAQIPFVRGAVGYISDSDVPGIAFDAANDEGEYVLTQYAMAPIVLIRGTGQEWNIANLSNQAFSAWNASHGGSFGVTPFKGDLYLLHRIGG